MPKKNPIGKFLLAVVFLSFLATDSFSQCQKRPTGISCQSEIVSAEGSDIRAEAQVVKHSGSELVAVVLVTASDRRLNTDREAWAKIGFKSFLFQAETNLRKTDPNYVIEETVIVLKSAALEAQTRGNFVLWLREGGPRFDLSPIIKDIREAQ